MLPSSTNGSNYGIHKCGGSYTYCDGDCLHCDQANIIYSNRTETTSSISTIHIVERPD